MQQKPTRIDELKKKIEELDWLDGFKDGQLDIGVLRERSSQADQ